ncbi:hypothetical protein C1881_08650 [Slackia isoflavoniconvertens]|uniref:HTH luxR-type domain-containing protein n=1 Tax=Slackia isoflavoniconvertens TaxID=572010 RepID=A0A369LCG7_9ACTN|nr:hypothetical protein C1881_08650 [Slackia isoflavoniconvertens]
MGVFSFQSAQRILRYPEQTVKTHVRNLYRKLDVHSRDELFSLFDGIGGK